ncbi:hypothetical protein GJ496_005545 [Pomphorhynchus laevis]|nr:hypothetical protein GJ496_005545 [Pomphorhynchus laevis]
MQSCKNGSQRHRHQIDDSAALRRCPTLTGSETAISLDVKRKDDASRVSATTHSTASCFAITSSSSEKGLHFLNCYLLSYFPSRRCVVEIEDVGFAVQKRMLLFDNPQPPHTKYNSISSDATHIKMQRVAKISKFALTKTSSLDDAEAVVSNTVAFCKQLMQICEKLEQRIERLRNLRLSLCCCQHSCGDEQNKRSKITRKNADKLLHGSTIEKRVIRDIDQYKEERNRVLQAWYDRTKAPSFAMLEQPILRNIEQVHNHDCHFAI